MTEAVSTGSTTEEVSTHVRTFLIADVRGYTRFTVEHGDEAAAKLATRFAELATEVVEAREGKVIELRGDEALAVFTSARQALRASTDLQNRFVTESRESSLPFRVGIGLDSGEAIPVAEGYRGAALNLAARLCALAGAGEVLSSDTVSNLARKIEGLEYVDRGSVQLKGFADDVRVVEVRVSSPDASTVGVSVAHPAEVGVTERPLPIGGFLGALPGGMLVSREQELGKILAAVDVVAGGAGRLVLLAGEPGAGKTRLAQEVTLNVRNRDFLIATGTCYEPRQSVPYYPFLDVLATLYGSSSPSVRSTIGERWPYLGRLLPEAGIPAPTSASEGQEEQERLFRAIAGFLQAIAEESPVAILLDDLHWADSSSLDLLQHLARQTRADRVLLLATYRDVEVGRQHPLEQALHDLNRQGLVERISVRRMEKEGTAALVAGSFGQEQISPEFAELVHRHTEGNPFFTQEVLRALVERGDIYREDGHWERREIGEIEVPESVRATIGARLSRLGEAAQEILREASVLGQTFAFDDLRGMGDRSENQLEAALDEATGAGVMRETGKDEYGFNHALTQQALYGELSGRKKRRLHLAAGEALEQQSEKVREKRVGELAWHFLEGDDPERALRYALLSGAQAEKVFARDEAKQHYRTALELAKDIGEQQRIAEATFKLAVILSQSGEREEALPLFQESTQLYRVLGNSVLQARSLAAIALIYRVQGRVEESSTATRQVEELLDAVARTPPSRDRALLYRIIGWVYFGTGRYGDQLAANDQAVNVARALDDPELLLQAQVWRFSVLAMLGRVDEVSSVADTVIPELERTGDLPTLLVALQSVGEGATVAGQLQTAQAYRERELALEERLADRQLQVVTEANLSWLNRLTGDWRKSREHAERSFALARAEGSVWMNQFPLTALGHLSFCEGEWETAKKYLEECIAIVEPMHDLQGLRWAHPTMAELDLLQGDVEGAVARLEPLLDRPGLQEHDVTTLLPVLAWAYLEQGNQNRAEQVLTEAIERAKSQQNKLALVDALRVQGMLLARYQRWKEAERIFKENIDSAQSMPYPYAEGRTLFEWGKMDTAKGEPQAARDRFEQALAIFQRLGAKKDIERTKLALGSISTA